MTRKKSTTREMDEAGSLLVPRHSLDYSSPNLLDDGSPTPSPTSLKQVDQALKSTEKSGKSLTKTARGYIKGVVQTVSKGEDEASTLLTHMLSTFFIGRILKIPTL